MSTVSRTEAPEAGHRTGWQIHQAAVPASLDDPQAWALLGSVASGQAVDLALYGYDDLAPAPAETHAYLSNQVSSIRALLVATAPDAPPQPDAVVGSVRLVLQRESNTRTAFMELRVRPDARHQGVGSALLAAAEKLAAEHGRTTFIVHSEHMGEPARDEPHLAPPTGSGRLRPDDAAVAFAHAHGYRLEQAERYSVLELPVDPALVTRLHDDAAARAGADYRLVAWTDRTPDAWVDDVTHLYTRMSTDIPSAGLDVEEEVWDAERLRAMETQIEASESGYLLVAAEHVPTGRLAAFTMVQYPLAKPEVVFQEDTLVLAEHRRRRLGMLVKTDALRRLVELRPGARRIHTWNAEENEHMLAINVALGFRPTGVIGMWQKRTGNPADDGAPEG
ncbi:GNAT family N-acetyltransferase [Cellulomonas sp. APG4]|uniref:GNAT family N-acetyltransferase n=1 Tax=Cellulomonas sp. APG4 TaxID=1538656 RepID=UPI00137A9D40|nr:GNAT family N-acetyltransferase [Cellulomonas sp. APG4]NCT92435.1 GNAT family N-acetyltransferase [Cellulomonas sp. APG4]